ncbi:MAG: hypothetical protein IKB16_04000 [Lentisphaeria bacterium]|nr:hypothetical protein [Lentisphaeria bacterium]
MKTQLILKRFLPVIFLLLLFAGTFAAYIKNSKETVAASVEDRDALEFLSFQPEQVRAIRISGGGDSITIQSKDNVWILPESYGAYVSRQTVIEFLTQLSRTRPLRTLETADDETLKKLNLSKDPSAKLGAGGGIDVELTGSDGKQIAKFTLGKAHIKRETGALYQTGKMAYDGRYIRYDKKDGKSVIFLIGRVFDRCMPAAAYWIEPLKLPATNQVFRVQYSQRDGKGKPQIVWSVIPDPRRRTFTLLFPPGKTLALNDLARRLEVLSSPFSRDLVPPATAAKLKFTDELQVITSTGQIFTLAMAKMPERGTAAATLRISLIPNRLKRMSGESDADYQKRVRQFTAALEYDRKAFAGRVFYIKEDLMKLLASVPEEKKSIPKAVGK